MRAEAVGPVLVHELARTLIAIGLDLRAARPRHGLPRHGRHAPVQPSGNDATMDHGHDSQREADTAGFGSMPDPWSLDLSSPDAVIAALDAGATANLQAACREGSIDHVLVPRGSTPGSSPRLIATGDLHDNPMHLRRVCELAGLLPDEHGSTAALAHLTLHELIHGERLMNGMDMSYRVLVRAAALKARFPGHVHLLLANHELAQIVGAGVMKNGVNCVRAFNEGLAYVFGELAEEVSGGIARLIRSMPLALRVTLGDDRTLLCAHSIPGPSAVDDGFDWTVLSRPLTESDLTPRIGAAHMMVWGRGYQEPAFLSEVARRLGADVLILGHELAEDGVRVIEPCAVVLNSDHPRGRAAVLGLAQLPTLTQIVGASVRVGSTL